MKDIHLGKVVPYKNGAYRTLQEISYIFVCPDCEYRWTAFNEEAIESVRNAHNRSVHPEKVLDVLWADSPLSITQFELEEEKVEKTVRERSSRSKKHTTEKSPKGTVL